MRVVRLNELCSNGFKIGFPRPAQRIFFVFHRVAAHVHVVKPQKGRFPSGVRRKIITSTRIVRSAPYVA